MAAVIMGSCKRGFLVRQPWIACPKDPRTEGVKIPPVRGPCADFQYFICIVLPPAGDFLSVAKERFTVVSAGFQPFVRRENRDTSSKPPCCIRHRRRFGGFLKNASRNRWFLHFLLVCKSCGLSPAETGN